MENIIKSEIYENKTVLSETGEQPIDADFTLPEYYPDIKKILKCCCVARVSSKGLNGNSITAEGIAAITAIYIDNDNMLNAYEYSYPFSKSFDAPDIGGGACICVGAKTDYINCRAVTARKIDIHGAVSLTATVTEKQATEIITDTDNGDIEVLKKIVPANTPLSCTEKTAAIEEDIEIGAGAKDINCLIRYGAAVFLKESKIIGGKAMIKGEVAVNILYCNEEGEIASVKENLPFSQMTEIEAAGDECGIDTSAEISFLEVKPKSDADGRTRSISVNAKILLGVYTYCNQDTEVVLDAYSRKYATSTEKKELTFTKITDRINENFTVKEILEFENGGISRVFDMWCTLKNSNQKYESGNLNFDGILNANLIVSGEDGIPAFYEREVPFKLSVPLSGSKENLEAEPRISVSSCSYTILSNGNIEIRAELCINGAVYECIKRTVLTDIKIDYDKPAQKKADCAMTVYFASPGESVWDIAAMYLADTEEIKEINGITDETIKEEKMILVPIS